MEDQEAQGKAMMANMAAMNAICREMKVIPELPSEVPQDSHPLNRVEFPDVGGILTYMDGYDHPYKGFPFHEFVEKIDVIKKIIRQTQSGFFHALMRHDESGKVIGVKPTTYLLVPLLPFLVFLGRILIRTFTYTFFRLIDRFRVKTERYSDAVREIHRAFSVERPGESPATRELRLQMRDVECMILEFDNAYRYRAQDVLVEFDKAALAKHPAREMLRVLDIIIAREKVVDVQNTWRLLKHFVTWYMRFDRPLLNLFADVIGEINPEAVALSVEDRYFAGQRKDYTFGFQSSCQPSTSTSARDSLPAPVPSS